MNIFESLESVLNQIMGVIPKLAGALTLLIVGWIVAKLVSALIARILLRIGLNKLAQKLNEN